MTNAFARISWLEDVIRAQLPDINLNSAPNLIVGPAEVAGTLSGGCRTCNRTALVGRAYTELINVRASIL